MMELTKIEHHLPCGTGALVLEYKVLRCVECGEIIGFDRHDRTSEGHHISEFNYCPMCGSKADE